MLIENCCSGALDRWLAGPDILHSINPELVVARITGLGQFVPYSQQLGFASWPNDYVCAVIMRI